MDAFTKTPGEELDYGVTWTKFLAGATITSSSFTIESLAGEVVPALTQSNDAFDDSNTSVELEVGTVDTAYDVTNKIVFGATGRKAERAFRLSIVAKKPENPC